MKRKIIEIDEEKCNGCGQCIPDCHEGALQIVDGKAKLINEVFCDGLGDCLKSCPFDAIKIVEREAEAYDEEQVKARQQEKLPCGCPGTMQKTIQRNSSATNSSDYKPQSELLTWPIQLKLLNPNAPYLEGADLVIAADCTAFSYPDFHRKFLKGKVLVIFCPKLDECLDSYVEKLAEIFKTKNIKSLSIVHMEVPCCGGVEMIAREAMDKSDKNITIKDYTVSIDGELI